MHEMMQVYVCLDAGAAVPDVETIARRAAREIDIDHALQKLAMR